MKSPVKVALLAAIPFELLNFCLLSGRYPDHLPHLFMKKVIAIEWIGLHWLGILTMNAVGNMGSSLLWQILAFVFCGYLETAILLAILLYAARGFLRRSRHQAIHS